LRLTALIIVTIIAFNVDFLGFLAKEKGALFALFTIPIMLLDYFIMLFGVACGFGKYVLN